MQKLFAAAVGAPKAAAAVREIVVPADATGILITASTAE